LKNRLPISIVIATLGGDTLIQTLKFLNKDNVIPDEIICVIPATKFLDNNIFNFENIKIIKTDFFGQVKQRIEGFKYVVNDFVLQLDDDLELGGDDIQKLLDQLIKLGPKNCLGPQMFDTTRNIYLYQIEKGWRKWESYFFEFLIGGSKFGESRMGTISKSGINFGVDINKMNNVIFETEWLAGGCILYYKNDILLNNFYPFDGKAYSEDIIHSILLRKTGVRMWITKNVTCRLELPYSLSDTNNVKKIEHVQIYINKLLKNKIYRWRIRNYFLSFRKLIVKIIKIF
jgi:hypothetical protein